MHYIIYDGRADKVDLISTARPGIDINFAFHPSNLFFTLSMKNWKELVFFADIIIGNPKYFPCSRPPEFQKTMRFAPKPFMGLFLETTIVDLA